MAVDISPTNVSIAPPAILATDARTERERILHALKDKVLSTRAGAAAFNAMVACRRGFAFAATKMLEEIEKKHLDPHKAFDLILAASKHSASRDVDVSQVLDPFLKKDGVMEWMGDMVEQQIKDANQVAKQTKLEAAEERRQKPIPIGITLDPIENVTELPRGTSVTMIGFAADVRLALDYTARQAAKASLRVVKFSSRATGLPGQEEKNVLVIPFQQWKEKGYNRRQLAGLLGEFLLPVHTDLLVIDDVHRLSSSKHTGFKGGHIGAVAGDVHRDVMRWCKEAGIGVIVGVGRTEEYTEEDFDLATAGWEQLKQFSTIIVATHENDYNNHKVCIRVGNPPVIVSEVSEEEYAAAGKGANAILVN